MIFPDSLLAFNNFIQGSFGIAENSLNGLHVFLGSIVVRIYMGLPGLFARQTGN
jgi:hypothetical protein